MYVCVICGFTIPFNETLEQDYHLILNMTAIASKALITKWEICTKYLTQNIDRKNSIFPTYSLN